VVREAVQVGHRDPLGPDGRVIGEPLIDVEGIVYAEIDLSRCIQPRQMHDITGHYNRFDIFDLRVNRRALAPVQFVDADVPPSEIADEAIETLSRITETLQ
jgi:nitrilase